MHPARYLLAEAMDDEVGAGWTLDPEKRRRAGLPLQGSLFAVPSGASARRSGAAAT